MQNLLYESVWNRSKSRAEKNYKLNSLYRICLDVKFRTRKVFTSLFGNSRNFDESPFWTIVVWNRNNFLSSFSFQFHVLLLRAVIEHTPTLCLGVRIGEKRVNIHQNNNSLTFWEVDLQLHYGDWVVHPLPVIHNQSHSQSLSQSHWQRVADHVRVPN